MQIKKKLMYAIAWIKKKNNKFCKNSKLIVSIYILYSIFSKKTKHLIKDGNLRYAIFFVTFVIIGGVVGYLVGIIIKYFYPLLLLKLRCLILNIFGIIEFNKLYTK